MSHLSDRATARNNDPVPEDLHRNRDPQHLALEAWDAPSWREAAADYHKDRAGRRVAVEIEPQRLVRLRRLMAAGISLERAWHALQRNRPTPKATIDAVVQAVRERGLRALDQPGTARRLAACDANVRSEITKRISLIFGENDSE
jgi:hypothetical protein